MALPWLRLLDAAIGMSDIARRLTRRSSQTVEEAGPERSGLRLTADATGPLEARLAGVVVAALKEAFDRDTRRLELEREQVDVERQQAERALRLELLRQAGDREIGRLRLLTAVAVTGWLGALFFSTRLADGPAIVRGLYGAGWALLLAAVGAASVAQQRVARALARTGDGQVGSGGGRVASDPDSLSSGMAASLTPWLIVAGLAAIAVSVLMM